MANGKCRMHGGKSTGAPPENKHAVTHGIYARGLRDHEKQVWHAIDVEGVDDEIRLIKTQIARAFEMQLEAEDHPDNEHIGFELAEIKRKMGEFNQGSDSEDDPPGIDEEDWIDWSERDEANVSIPNETIKIRKRPDYRGIIVKLLGTLARLMATKSRLGGSGKGAEDIAREIQEFIAQAKRVTTGGDGANTSTDTAMDSP